MKNRDRKRKLDRQKDGHKVEVIYLDQACISTWLIKFSVPYPQVKSISECNLK